jgi:hypothetical protein
MTAAERAMTFLDTAGRRLEAVWTRNLLGRGSRQAVLTALAAFQGEDGGFGRGLEVDIAAPDSQPFAARLAMQVLVALGTAPGEPIVQSLAGWLEREQDDDGCWRLPPGVYQHDLAPWFGDWTFPSLNPALCLAGLAKRLGIGSDRLFARVATLVEERASMTEAESGDFYTLLPYVEYFPWIDHPHREEILRRLATTIEQTARAGKYADAGHFFEHVGPADGELARRLPRALVQQQLHRLHTEQQSDGGWPSPYNAAWRPWATATAVATLRGYGLA